MRHTQYNDSHSRVIPDRATGYDSVDAGGFGISMSNWEQTGDGAVLTTVEDLLLWDRNFYQPTVGGADTVSLMQAPGRLSNGTILAYAAGLGIEEYRGLKTVSHGGAWAGYRAQLLRFPEQKFSVACLCNLGSSNPDDLAKKVAEVYLSDLMKPETVVQMGSSAPSIDLPGPDLEKRAGAYRNPKTGGIWRLAVAEGKLMVDTSRFRFRVVPTTADTFRAEDAPLPIVVTFETGASGTRPRLRVRIADEKEDRIMDPIDVWIPTPAQLAEMAGSYRSDELDTMATVMVKDGKLMLVHRSVGEEPMTPALKDSFTVSGLDIVFARNSKGRIDGFSLSSGRVKNIRFARQARL